MGEDGERKRRAETACRLAAAASDAFFAFSCLALRSPASISAWELIAEMNHSCPQFFTQRKRNMNRIM